MELIFRAYKVISICHVYEFVGALLIMNECYRKSLIIIKKTGWRVKEKPIEKKMIRINIVIILTKGFNFDQNVIWISSFLTQVHFG